MVSCIFPNPYACKKAIGGQKKTKKMTPKWPNPPLRDLCALWSWDTGWGVGVRESCFFLVVIFYTKDIHKCYKHMMFSFRMKGDVITDHFLMIWFQIDSLDTVGFRIYHGWSRVLNQKVTFWVVNVLMGGGGVTGWGCPLPLRPCCDAELLPLSFGL